MPSLLRRTPIRWFFLAHLQSGLGAGAGYVALMLVAYERIGSAWAATAVLLADLLPSMLLGPLLGGLVDRTDRLRCAIAADVIRAAAMAGLVLAGGTAALIALALVAGLGNALFRPATCALLPALVPAERLAAANALYDALRNAGQLLGPACAGALLLVAAPEAVLGAQRRHLRRLRAAAAAAAPRDPPDRRTRTPARRSLLAETGAGLRAVLGDPRGAHARRDLRRRGPGGGHDERRRAGARPGGARAPAAPASPRCCAPTASAWSTGSLLGAGGTGARRPAPPLPREPRACSRPDCSARRPPSRCPPRWRASPLTGAGNGLFVVSDRILLQRLVAERFHGRAFGLLDAFDAWGFAGALLAGGALASVAGGRATFAVAGAGALAVLLVATFALTYTTPRGATDGLEVVSTDDDLSQRPMEPSMPWRRF